MTDRAYIVSRTLENKIMIAEINHQNPMLVTLDVLKEILAILKEQQAEIERLKPKKGQWDYGTQCSVCKGTIIPPKDRKVRINFCPWCGADMRDQYE